MIIMTTSLLSTKDVPGGISPIRVWVHSDLQLAVPDQARKTLATAVDDLQELDINLDAIWCLGDAHCGRDENALEKVAGINIEQLKRLSAPVYYVMGNHEMDLTARDVRSFPLHEQALQAGWHVAALDDFYFTAQFGSFLVIFMGDHAALQNQGNWWTSHGNTKGDDYPYSPEHYKTVRRQIRDYNGPVIIASHYALPGGQRPSSLLGHLLPLPENVRLHLHGHAHIGDMVHNKERPWQRENPIEGDERMQFNISALESHRTSGSHSALLSLYPDKTITLQIRCHLEKKWLDEFTL